MRVFGTLLLCFITCCIFGQSTYGSLSGTVYNKETEKPIRIELKLFTIDSSYVSSAKSNEKGKYNLVGIKKGKYYLKAGDGGNGGYAVYYSGIIEVTKQSRINIALKRNPFVKPTGPVEMGPVIETIVYSK